MINPMKKQLEKMRQKGRDAMKRKICMLMAGTLALALLAGCTTPVAQEQKSGSTEPQMAQSASDTPTSSAPKASEAAEKENVIEMPALVELGYATEGLGGWDVVIALDDTQQQELRDLLQRNTWKVANDLPDGIGFGDGSLNARDQTEKYRLVVLGTLNSNSSTLLMVENEGEKTFYYADAAVGADAEAFSEALKPMQ